jgi:hypothetical protein
MTAPKLSPEFERRLALGPREALVRAVLLLAVPDGPAGGRPTRGAARQETLAAIRTTASLALPEIDAVLARWGGRRLAEIGRAHV